MRRLHILFFAFLSVQDKGCYSNDTHPSPSPPLKFLAWFGVYPSNTLYCLKMSFLVKDYKHAMPCRQISSFKERLILNMIFIEKEERDKKE